MAAKKIPEKKQPAQHQNQQPGIESEMHPQPEYIDSDYKGSDKLAGKVVVITGGDSGIGRAVAVHCAKEGAKLVIAYLNEHDDAKKTKQLVEDSGQECLLLSGDVGNAYFCKKIISETIKMFNQIDVLINNAGELHAHEQFSTITEVQLLRIFKTNIFSYFYMAEAAIPYLEEGSCIINTADVVAYKGHAEFADYSATKGAIISLTRSLAKNLMDKKIRVNAVAPGPVWTPLIPSTFPAEKVKTFGVQVPMKRAAQPKEIAPSYIFLASKDASYFSGQVLHPNGGTIVNG